MFSVVSWHDELMWTQEISSEQSKAPMDTSCGNHPLVWARKMAAASSRGQEGDEMRCLSLLISSQQDEMKCREAGEHLLSARLVRLRWEWRMEEQSKGDKTCYSLLESFSQEQHSFRLDQSQQCKNVHLNKQSENPIIKMYFSLNQEKKRIGQQNAYNTILYVSLGLRLRRLSTKGRPLIAGLTVWSLAPHDVHMLDMALTYVMSKPFVTAL